MRIVIINGSPRKNGACGKILKYLNDYLEKDNPETKINLINLIDFNIKYCTGCQNCYKTGKCVIIDDNVENIHDLIKSADGIILSSPVYASNVSGLLKSFHDRVHMTMEQLLYRKPCVAIVTYENLMGHKTTNILKEMVRNAGGYTVSSLTIKNTFNNDPLISKNRAKIERAGSNLVRKIVRNKPPLFSLLYSIIAINFFLKPFVFKNKENYKGIIDSWVEKKLIKCDIVKE
ncbi:MAG: flavodoxin family protein [Treponema sp.]|nr:flavodoxin family protein [Treponema sp.]